MPPAKRPLRLLVYDRTCTRKLGVGLSTAWLVGSALYRRRRLLDASLGVESWAEALAWLATCEPARPIAEIQYWGHGRWGKVLVGKDALDASALRPGHALGRSIAAVRERLLPKAEALVWLRTCEAFGASAGLDFAQRLADTFGARVAGHTFIIGTVQSGLRTLAPGHRPAWSSEEGLAEGTPDDPKRAYRSQLGRPRTITCFSSTVPRAWFDEDGVRRSAP